GDVGVSRRLEGAGECEDGAFAVAISMNAIGMSNGGDYVLPSSVCTNHFHHIAGFITELGRQRQRARSAGASVHRSNMAATIASGASS
ncbi:hypothetical protein, partial [Burkholderia vietnamiensis]